MDNFKYEHRVVLFLDILGFKNIVNESVANDEIAARIHTALHQIHLEYSDQTDSDQTDSDQTDSDQTDSDQTDSFDDDTKLTFFSDSLFLTQKFHTHEYTDVYLFLNTAAFIMNSFLAYGLFPRGAITHGQCLHEKVQNNHSNARIDTSICYGPAINNAYIAEETKAIWPRIIVDPEVLINGIGNDKINNHEDSTKYFGELVKNDGTVFYLDTLRLGDYDSHKFISFIKKVREQVIQNLKKQTDNHIREKYELFADYFNSKVKELNLGEGRDDSISSIPDSLIRPDEENFNKVKRLFEKVNKNRVVSNPSSSK